MYCKMNIVSKSSFQSLRDCASEYLTKLGNSRFATMTAKISCVYKQETTKCIVHKICDFIFCVYKLKCNEININQ